MIHGDLKGVCLQFIEGFFIILTSVSGKSNILIDQIGNARIADFGLLTIISDPANPSCSASYTQGGTARWMSPELIDPQRFKFKTSCPTIRSDCYALGMVIYETISGHVPFHELADMAVIVNILKGRHPPREDRFTDDLWKMLKRCWVPHPKKRPGIEDVLRCLEKAPNAPGAAKWWIPTIFSEFRPQPSLPTASLATPRDSCIPPWRGFLRILRLPRQTSPWLVRLEGDQNRTVEANNRNTLPSRNENNQEVRFAVSGDKNAQARSNPTHP